MSEYTITLHDLIKSGFDIGLKDYEIFDEKYRQVLNNAIIKHYQFHEIGFQNPTMFKDRLNARMDLIMRNKYNMLYDIKKTEFNPLYNIELHEKYTRKIDNTNEGVEEQNSENTETTINNTNNKGYSSRYPADSLTSDDLTSPLYADVGNTSNTNETLTDENKSNIKSSNTITGNTVEEFEHTQEGSSAGLPFSKALIQFKQYVSQYNLDEQVISELSDLFMTVW